MTLKINHYQTPSHMLHIAAHDFLAELEKVCEQKAFFDLALSGGSTAQEFFKALLPIALHHPKLKQIRFFFSDERAVPMSSPQSNAGNAWRQLIKPLGLSIEQFFPMYEHHSAEMCAKNYQELLLQKLVVVNKVPSFDLLYLGLGLDGHIASLFPKSRLLTMTDLVKSTIEPGIEYERITLMPKVLHAARNICLLATGPQKKALLDQMLTDKTCELPAQLILRKPKNSVVVLLA